MSLLIADYPSSASQRKSTSLIVILMCLLFVICRGMMCCKSGAQFDYWYRAREAGKKYK